VRVDLGAITRNYDRIAAHTGVDVMPVLKANAYGHGLVEVAKALDRHGVPAMGLAYLEEALLLREEGVQADLLVLGGILNDQIPDFLRHNVMMTASSVDKVRAIQAAAKAAGIRGKVHLKIDTGMGRIGVRVATAPALIDAALDAPDVEICGVFSHFANADAAALDHARRQVAKFEEVLTHFDRRGVPRPPAHMANSGGVLQLPEARFDMVRPGILLFGVYPSAECQRPIEVEPALEWVSRVVYFKVVQAGDSVSYGSLWTAQEDTRVITVPVGYGDGYFRRGTGRAEVLVGGSRASVVGAICMDAIMVDIGQGSAWNGDEVVLIGRQGAASITVEDVAEWAGTIGYEVLTNINTRVPRRYMSS